MNKILIFVLTGFVIVMLGALGSACSCIAPGSPAEEFQNFDVVFKGKVLDVSEDISSNSYKINFDVEKSWKGVEDGEVRIRAPISSASCGYDDPDMLKDKEYVVYARESEEGLSTNICSRTALFENAEEDIEYLESLDDIGSNPLADNEEDLSFWQKVKNFFRKLFD